MRKSKISILNYTSGCVNLIDFRFIQISIKFRRLSKALFPINTRPDVRHVDVCKGLSGWRPPPPIGLSTVECLVAIWRICRVVSARDSLDMPLLRKPDSSFKIHLMAVG